MGPPLDPRFAQPRTLVFGIGAQKAATSWLHKHLRDHPEIRLPVRKEQHYWTTRLQQQPCARLAWAQEHLAKSAQRGLFKRLTRTARGRRQDEAWRLTEVMLRHEPQAVAHAAYADVLFQSYAGEPVLGEITPEYALLAPAGFAEMAALGADVRFILILRDPLDRLWSGVRQHVRKAQGPAAVTPANAAARLAEALRDPDDPAMLRSRYDVTIERLESVVAAEKVLYLFFETMFQQSEMDRVTNFLGVARMAAPVDQKVHVGVGGDIGVDDELMRLAARSLWPTYDFVRARFGDRVPGAWWTPQAGAPALAVAAQP